MPFAFESTLISYLGAFQLPLPIGRSTGGNDRACGFIANSAPAFLVSTPERS